MFDARQGLGVNNKAHIIIRTTSLPCVTIRRSIRIRLLNLVAQPTRFYGTRCSALALTAVTVIQKMLWVAGFLPATLRICHGENKRDSRLV